MEKEVRDEANRRVRAVEAEVKEEGESALRDILATTMQRLTTDVVSETTVSVVPIPSDDMKGRIIGREGRNIRALEAATGVDLIIDDTPDAVTLSGFDPVRREIARVALTQAGDRRPHPPDAHRGGGGEGAPGGRRRHQGRPASRRPSRRAVPGLHPEILKTLGRLQVPH